MVRSYGGPNSSYTALLHSPADVVVDKNGFVYVDDEGNDRLVVLTPNLEYGRSLDGVFPASRLASFRRRMQIDKESGHFFVTHGVADGEKNAYNTHVFAC